MQRRQHESTGGPTRAARGRHEVNPGCEILVEAIDTVPIEVLARAE
jgi:hypothetical protein